MKKLHITVKDKIATYKKRDGVIVCGNSDYQIVFTFDEEWNGKSKKARFVYNGESKNVDFTDATTCKVPVISDATSVAVGVYADELSTTPTIIPCKRSILCGS